MAIRERKMTIYATSNHPKDIQDAVDKAVAEGQYTIILPEGTGESSSYGENIQYSLR